tara:strand:- start:20926 stop:21312 length:387 start_codon:yes stop_codon:yes gene_type:complete
MEFINKFIAVERYVRSGIQPVYLMDYDPKYVYHTLLSPVTAESREFSITDAGSEKVRIPVFAYKTGKEPPSGIFGYGVQLGMQAHSLCHHAFTHVVLVLGVECHDLAKEEEGEDAHRVYMGISFAREK